MTLTSPAVTITPPDLSTVGPPVYANSATMTFTPYDFRITFSLLTMPDDQGSIPEPGAAVLTPRAVAEVVVPAGVVGQLADVLRAELKQYGERFGEPQRGVE
jgi:hypothetical protein